MAIICRDHRLLFIQTPRTGCTAIEQLLKDRFGGEQLPAENVCDADGYIKVPSKHCTVQQLLDHGVISAADASKLLVFAGVRNPFDSLVSLYVKKGQGYQHELADPDSWVHKVRGYVDEMEYCRTHSFDEWIEKHYKVSWMDRVLGRGQRELYGRYTRGANRVIRFERLQQDFESVMREAGVKGDVSIPRVNPTVHRGPNYQSYYAPSSRKLVEYVFRPDVERYGYTFDGLDETHTPARQVVAS